MGSKGGAKSLWDCFGEATRNSNTTFYEHQEYPISASFSKYEKLFQKFKPTFSSQNLTRVNKQVVTANGTDGFNGSIAHVPGIKGMYDHERGAANVPFPGGSLVKEFHLYFPCRANKKCSWDWLSRISSDSPKVQSHHCDFIICSWGSSNSWLQKVRQSLFCGSLACIQRMREILSRKIFPSSFLPVQARHQFRYVDLFWVSSSIKQSKKI